MTVTADIGRPADRGGAPALSGHRHHGRQHLRRSAVAAGPLPAAGGIKPYLVTEFGPPGTWEVGTTSFGAAPELTSTQKAAFYRDRVYPGCLEARGLCLGGLAFTWGFKMEATSTWYGMFLPGGDKLAAVDAMTEAWSGRPPANLCPEIRTFALRGDDVVQPGDTVRVDLEIVDPEGAAVDVLWQGSPGGHRISDRR